MRDSLKPGAPHLWFPVANTGKLGQALGKAAAIGKGGGSAPATADASAEDAVLVLLLCIAGLVVRSGLLIRKRDSA